MHWPRAVDVMLITALATVTLAPGVDRPTFVTFGALPPRASYDIVAAAGPRDMMRFVAAVLASDLGLPLPPTVVLRTYSTRASFREGLVRDVGVPGLVAAELAGSALGLALPRSVMLFTAGADDDRVRLVAHEVMHLVQLELAGPGARPAQWVMEGTAEWAALAVLDRLGAVDVAGRRHAARQGAARYLEMHPHFTPASVRRPVDFRGWQRRTGSVLAYQVAYALAERLVDRHGVPRVIEYFRAFRHTADAGANFERAFAIPTDVFITEVFRAMRATPASAALPTG